MPFDWFWIKKRITRWKHSFSSQQAMTSIWDWNAIGISWATGKFRGKILFYFKINLKKNGIFRHVKIFRSSEKYMNLRLKEQEDSTKPKCKQTSVPVQGTLISLPVEKIVEKKSQKGLYCGFQILKRKWWALVKIGHWWKLSYCLETKHILRIHLKVNFLYELDEWQRVGSRRAKSDGKKGAASGGFYMVVARGFQWKVTKQNIVEFFKGIKILNGECGVNIIKDGAMVAYVELASNADVKKALAMDNKRVDSRTIHGIFGR